MVKRSVEIFLEVINLLTVTPNKNMLTSFNSSSFQVDFTKVYCFWGAISVTIYFDDDNT
jgi:hypothetical protein